MRKYLLSLSVIVSFLLYSQYQKQESVAVKKAPLFIPESQPAVPPSPSQTAYRDGVYIGDSVDAFYGNVQVRVTISAGKITAVEFLDAPKDRETSREISSFSEPKLISEALTVQSAEVEIITGATQTSDGFKSSLKSALQKAI